MVYLEMVTVGKNVMVSLLCFGLALRLTIHGMQLNFKHRIYML